MLGARPPDHVAHVALGEGVSGHVGHVVAGLAQTGDDAFKLVHAFGEAQRGEYFGLRGIGEAVVEFRDHAVAELAAQIEECALSFGNGDGNDAFALFAHFADSRALRQGVEVHVRARENGGHARVPDVVACGVLLETGQRESAGRFGNGAGVVEDVLERGADFVVGAGDDFVEVLAQHAEGFVADALHGHAVGKQGNTVEGDGLARLPRGLEAGGALGFHADDLHLRQNLLDVHGDARGESAAAHLNEHVRETAVLFQQFAGDGALTGNDVGIVVGGE